MRPGKPETPNGDLFRASPEAILDPAHELIRLAALIGRERAGEASGARYHEAGGRRGLAHPSYGRAASVEAHEGLER